MTVLKRVYFIARNIIRGGNLGDQWGTVNQTFRWMIELLISPKTSEIFNIIKFYSVSHSLYCLCSRESHTAHCIDNFDHC